MTTQYEKQAAPRQELKKTFILFKHCQLILGDAKATSLLCSLCVDKTATGNFCSSRVPTDDEVIAMAKANHDLKVEEDCQAACRPANPPQAKTAAKNFSIRDHCVFLSVVYTAKALDRLHRDLPGYRLEVVKGVCSQPFACSCPRPSTPLRELMTQATAAVQAKVDRESQALEEYCDMQWCEAKRQLFKLVKTGTNTVTRRWDWCTHAHRSRARRCYSTTLPAEVSFSILRSRWLVRPTQRGRSTLQRNMAAARRRNVLSFIFSLLLVTFLPLLTPSRHHPRLSLGASLQRTRSG